MIDCLLELLQDKELLLNDQTIDAFSEAQQLLHDEDIADVLWLAHKIGGPLDQPDEIKKTDSDVQSMQTVDLFPLTVSPSASVSMSIPEVNNSETSEVEKMEEGLPIQVQAAPALPDTRGVARVLRPLMHKVPSLTRSTLDELATVNYIAENDIWLPILKPLPERWFDLELVIEASEFSFLWQDTLAEFQHLLECQGAFRNVRTWSIENTKTKDPKLFAKTQVSNQTQPTRSPRELVDASGRRLVLLVSDCRSKLWQQGVLHDWLHLWSQQGPAAVVQLLPERLWSQSELDVGFAVQVSSLIPGTPNHKLQVKELPTRKRISPTDTLTVPVVTLTASALKQWALVVAAAGRQRAPARLFDLSWVKNKERDRVAAVIQPQSSGARLELFNATSSTMAQDLAKRMAAVPVDLSVVHMIQQELLPQVKAVHIAEVYASGLIAKVNSKQSESHKPVRYDFAPGVRGLLNKATPLDHTLEVIEVLSQRIARTLGFEIKSFTALLSPKSAWTKEMKEAILPFAQVATDVLHRLGGDYAELARKVEQDAQGRADWILKNDENEKIKNFPSLEGFDFIDARFIDSDISFPPPLRTVTFTIVSLEPEQDTKISQGLEEFEFTVATFVGSEGPWILQRQSQMALRYVEILLNDLALDMVAIPGGTFMMGSPDEEPERYKDESPLHKVNVESFYMGRYPITQAQWRVVANLPKVGCELKIDPGHFKGDNRPIEQVSWHDAVEFCIRFSAHTGREYRLPSEAEWEYACRAGTTTPFHFGDMITTEVANYNGSAYLDGLKGKYRRETTPVEHFGIANAFGLSDMHGNVFEWCQDQWHDNYEGAPTDGSAWITENDDAYRVFRGGSWNTYPWYCRSASRAYNNPDDRDFIIGFRLVCSAPRALQ